MEPRWPRWMVGCKSWTCVKKKENGGEKKKKKKEKKSSVERVAGKNEGETGGKVGLFHRWWSKSSASYVRFHPRS